VGNASGLLLEALATAIVAVAVLLPPLEADLSLPLVPAKGAHREPPTGQAVPPGLRARPLLEEHFP